MRNKIAEAKKAVEDSESTAPIEKLTKLVPLIEAAMAEAKEVPKTVKTSPNNYQVRKPPFTVLTFFRNKRRPSKMPFKM